MTQTCYKDVNSMPFLCKSTWIKLGWFNVKGIIQEYLEINNLQDDKNDGIMFIDAD